MDATDIGRALSQFGAFRAPVLMVHSSLSACGYIEGGTETVIASLRSWIDGATLAMPTHTYCYPRGGRPAPTFDAASTPSVVGAITNAFWRQSGVVRSAHPTHSVASSGSLATSICEEHEWARTPCGAGTPYEKLVQLGCAALMFGATLDGYTFFHTAEDAATVPYLYEARMYELFIRDACGIRWSMESRRQDMNVPRRFGQMDAFLEREALLKRVQLGNGELLFIPDARAVHSVLVDALRRDPFLLVAQAAA
jgi:aminoglycoside 3-N-acetyltransferase